MNPQRLKPAVFLACLAPLAYYALGVYRDTLGANPIEAVTRGLGTWALNLLLITLCVTPVRRLAGWPWVAPLRRMLGLYAFFYACLHLAAYVWADQFFDWTAIAGDILKRPFITVGMAAFALLVPLAATSNGAALRRLGGRRWRELHRAVYIIAILAVLHYAWMVKADLSSPLTYAAATAALLGLRVFWMEKERRLQLAGGRPRSGASPGRRVIPIAAVPPRR